MKKLVLALTLTTLVLAGFAAYLANELRIERARKPVVVAASADRVVPPALVSSAPVPGPIVSARPPVAAAGAVSEARPASASTAASEDRVRVPGVLLPQTKAEIEAVMRDQLEQFADPAGRAQFVAAAKQKYLGELAGASRKLAFTPEELERFAAILAEHVIRSAEQLTRCQLEPGCKPDMSGSRDADGMRREQIALLGQERYDRFVAYQEASGERAQVQQLRTQLPTGSEITEAQADRLIGVLAEERHRFNDEVKASGAQVYSTATMSVQVLSAVESDAPDHNARRIETAENFSRRLRDRAAEVLPPAQLDTFNQMQDQALAQLRSQVHQEQIVASARKAQGH